MEEMRVLTVKKLEGFRRLQSRYIAKEASGTHEVRFGGGAGS
jgi:hypothetical protein